MRTLLTSFLVLLCVTSTFGAEVIKPAPYPPSQEQTVINKDILDTNSDRTVKFQELNNDGPSGPVCENCAHEEQPNENNK